jgi:type III pantothenate kinase
MQLIIDIGNSSVKFAVFHFENLLEYGFIKNEDSLEEFNGLLNKYAQIDTAIISAVRDAAIIEQIKKRLNTIELSNATQLPIKLVYKSAETLGRDRIAAAVAASAFYGNPVLSIDAGTCITFDFVNKDAEYEGGAIAPGIDMRLKAMHQFTGKLPYVSFAHVKGRQNLIGSNTEESLLAGAVNGTINEIEKTIEYYRKQYPNLKVVICGGDATFLAKAIKNSIFADPLLVLKGLNIILRLNAPNK